MDLHVDSLPGRRVLAWSREDWAVFVTFWIVDSTVSWTVSVTVILKRSLGCNGRCRYLTEALVVGRLAKALASM